MSPGTIDPPRGASSGGWRARLGDGAWWMAHRSGWVATRSKFHPRSDLVILAYHNLRSPPFLRRVAGIQDLRSIFTRQMEWIARRMSPIGETDLLAWLAAERPLPSNAVLVTFDDGYRDLWQDARPILTRLGIPAVGFVTVSCLGTGRSIWPNRLYWWFHRTGVPRLTGPVAGFPELEVRPLPLDEESELRRTVRWVLSRLKGLPGEERRRALDDLAARLEVDPQDDPGEELPMLDWDQARALEADGIRLGSHGWTHEIMTGLNDEALERELRDSKDRLESELGRAVEGFAYPNGGTGDFDDRTRRALAARGYRYGMKFEPGRVPPEPDRYALPRLAPYDPSIGRFAATMIGLRRAAPSGPSDLP